MSLNGDRDHHMLSTDPSPIGPLSASDDSDDTNMQIDSDVDIHKLPDADADGEDDDDVDIEPAVIPAPAPAPASSSSHTAKRTVRMNDIVFVFSIHLLAQIKDEDEDSVRWRLFWGRHLWLMLWLAGLRGSLSGPFRRRRCVLCRRGVWCKEEGSEEEEAALQA